MISSDSDEQQDCFSPLGPKCRMQFYGTVIILFYLIILMFEILEFSLCKELYTKNKSAEDVSNVGDYQENFEKSHKWRTCR